VPTITALVAAFDAKDLHCSVANSSYNEYTKSRLKIYQIYTEFISEAKTSKWMLFSPMPFHSFT